jgi:hypothetical protein
MSGPFLYGHARTGSQREVLMVCRRGNQGVRRTFLKVEIEVFRSLSPRSCGRGYFIRTIRASAVYPFAASSRLSSIKLRRLRCQIDHWRLRRRCDSGLPWVDYRKRAEECRELAKKLSGSKPEDWTHFLEMAQTWEALADLHELSRKLKSSGVLLN